MCNEITLYEGQTIGILLEKFDIDEDTDAETPVAFEGTHTFVIYQDPWHKKALLTFTETAGLSKTYNEIYLSKNKAQNILKPNEYFASLHNDLDSNDGYEEGQWKIIVKPSRQNT